MDTPRDDDPFPIRLCRLWFGLRWTRWSDMLGHAIHDRVPRHMKLRTESEHDGARDRR